MSFDVAKTCLHTQGNDMTSSMTMRVNITYFIEAKMDAT